MMTPTLVSRSASAQKGVAILAITIILLLVATIGTLAIGRVGLQEQKIAGADVRSKEVYTAAQGGLDFAIDWFERNWNLLDFDQTNSEGRLYATLPDSAYSELPDGNLSDLRADDYTHEIHFVAMTDLEPANESMPVIVQVHSIATASSDDHITKTVKKDIFLGKTNPFSASSGGGGFGILDSPPIVVEGCFTEGAITGTPDISLPFPGGVGMGSTMGGASHTVDECFNADPSDPDSMDQHINLCNVDDYPDGCPPSGNPDNVSPAQALAAGDEFRQLLSPASLWNTIFGDLEQDYGLYRMEKRMPERVFFVNSNSIDGDGPYPRYQVQPGWNGSQWHADVGSASEPVVLYFDDSVGCPSINGGTTIYGIVYYEEDDCGNQGWGGGTIYGTLAKAGDLQKLNANTSLINSAMDFSGGVGTGTGTSTSINLGISNEQFSEVFGTWRDY